jgi:hypothetical protein
MSFIFYFLQNTTIICFDIILTYEMDEGSSCLMLASMMNQP